MKSPAPHRSARCWIARLGLRRHPEGGWYRETYRSRECIGASALPKRYGGDRSFSTAIYFLLSAGEVSRLHRLCSDEVWHFYCGGPLTIHVITPVGRYRRIKLGRRTGVFQTVVKRGWWFGATSGAGNGFSLAGCTVAPGFDFSDFEIGGRDALMHMCPAHERIIKRLT
jgi:predicted cupin superfamily sugar epimerase